MREIRTYGSVRGDRLPLTGEEREVVVESSTRLIEMDNQNKEIKYLLLKQDNGIILKKRVLTIYELEKFNKDYVIFYDDEKNEIEKLYVASYDKNTDFKNLSTNLNFEELKYANKIIESIKGDEK